MLCMPLTLSPSLSLTHPHTHTPAQAEVQKMLDEFDTNKDGTIDYEEFIRMLLPSDVKFSIAKSGSASGESSEAAAPKA